MSTSPTEPVPRPELPPHSAPNAGDRAPAASAPPVRHPDRIGPYHLLETIAEGGMGVVFKAEQRQPVRRLVAVKLIKPGMDSRQIIARFDGERQALAMMSHPNLARVLDAGTGEAGRPYFVMEYVPGTSITQFCDTHCYTIAQRLDLFRQACDAVQHAHQKAIIHRDLKPSNILVMLEGDKPMVKVIDFGLAKAMAQKLTDHTLYTEAGQFLGTREYMSPEQADGAGHDVDTRSDVYALGVVLYELLSGALPFGSLRNTGFAETQRIIREVDPPRPSTRLSGLGESAGDVARLRKTEANELCRQLASELEWIPLKAIRKDRAQRYSTVAELSRDIENYLCGRPLIAGPESAMYRLRKQLRRNKGKVAAAIAIFAVLVAGIVGTTIGLVGQARQRVLAQREAQNARTEAARQRAVSDFLRDMLSAADPGRMLGDKVTVLQAAQEALKRLDGGALKSEPMIEATVRDTIGATLVSLSRFDEAAPVYRRALEIRRSTLPADHAEVAENLNNLGWALRLNEKLTEAAPPLLEALEIRRRTLQANDPKFAESLNGVASLARMQGDVVRAEKLFREAVEIRRVASPPDEQALSVALNNLAGPLQDLGKLDEAERLMQETVAIRRRTLPARHPQTAQALHNLAQIVKENKRLGEAERLMRESLEICRETLPAGHLDIAWSLNGLGQILTSQGKLDDAERAYIEVLEIRRARLTDPSPGVAAALHNLAMVKRDQGNATEAERLFRESLDIYRRARPGGHRDTALVAARLAKLLRSRGQLAEATALLREALEIRTKVFPAGHQQTIAAMNELAAALKESGDTAEASRLEAEAGRLGQEKP